MFRLSPFLFFTLIYSSEYSYNHTGIILLIAWNLLCYLHFAFCLFVWLIKLKYVPHLSSHQDCFRGSYITLRGWKGGLQALNYWGNRNWRRDLIWKVDLRALLIACHQQSSCMRKSSMVGMVKLFKIAYFWKSVPEECKLKEWYITENYHFQRRESSSFMNW